MGLTNIQWVHGEPCDPHSEEGEQAQDKAICLILQKCEHCTRDNTYSVGQESDEGDQNTSVTKHSALELCISRKEFPAIILAYW